MSVRYHPEPETLAEYALGALAPGMELLVSGHLTFCPSCRKKAESYEILGGGALDACSTSEISAPSIEATLEMLDEPEADHRPILVKDPLYPAALQKFIPATTDDLDWSFRLPGIYEHELDGFSNETVSLIRAKPGSKMLSHTHDGEEATLLLSGQMKDGNRIYRKGDVAQADHDHDHKPEIIGEEMCVCLIVLSGKMKFTGTLGRALNVLVR